MAVCEDARNVTIKDQEGNEETKNVTSEDQESNEDTEGDVTAGDVDIESVRDGCQATSIADVLHRILNGQGNVSSALLNELPGHFYLVDPTAENNSICGDIPDTR